MGNLILRPSPLKFLERIQGDICDSIQPLSGPFRYFMVLVDASTRWSHMYLLSTRNYAFDKLITQVIQLKANFPKNGFVQSDWTMLSNSPLELSMVIVWLKGLKFNILSLISTHKMAW
jgi:hypothetical protein